MKRVNITLLNTISSLVLQILNIINGFVIPKIILSYFGSETNGLVSSITQFLSYINLIEGGIGSVVIANLFEPLVKKDYEKLSSVIKTANRFYRKIAFIFIGYSIVLSVIYPLVLKTVFSYTFVMTLILILSMNLFIQYCFSITLKSLLNADKKVYVVAFSQSLIIILNIILAYISVKIYPSIHMLKFLSGALFIIQPIIYGVYVKKHYNINKKSVYDDSLLKSRWNGFAINIAAFIHNSTDIAILTIFTDLTTVSIYSVYHMVASGLKQLIIAITNGINPTIGHLYYSDNKKELEKKFDLYEFVVFVLVFLLFSVGGMTITSFIMLYTKNVNDANYFQPVFGALICLSEALYLIKLPHLNLSYSANKFKEMTIPCYIEAFLNIIISIILVPKYKLIGVEIGTIVAMTYRMIFHVFYTSKCLIKRSQWVFYKKFIIFFITTIIGGGICLFIVPRVEYEFLNWIMHGFIYSLIMMILYIMITFIFYKEEYNYFKLFIKRFLSNKN